MTAAMAGAVEQQPRVHTGPYVYYPQGNDPVIVCGDRYVAVPPWTAWALTGVRGPELERKE